MASFGARIGVLVAVLASSLGAVVAVAAGAVVALPDGRGYELVSPPAKNGVEVIPQTDKTHVAPDGNGVTFSALGGFGDVSGSAFDFEYLSRRTGQPGTNGWTTHGINPLSRPTTVDTANSNASTYVDGFAPDLSVGIYKTWRPLTDAPNVAEVSKLYRITGLSGGAKAAQLLTDSINPIPDAWFEFLHGFFVRDIEPSYAGASTDLTHVVFESPLSLTPNSPPYQGFACVVAGAGCPAQLYENADGEVRLVGRIPDAPATSCDDAGGPACVSAPSSQTGISATGRQYSKRMVSADGRRILFQVPADADSGALYLREDGVRTEEIAQNGQLWTASADGTRAFFITSDGLVASDGDSLPDLYMYDRNAPAGERLTLISAGDSGNDGFVETVVDASADGRYVYFVCDGQLVAGEPPADIMGLYVWHDGDLRFIGTLRDLIEARSNGPRTSWFLGTPKTSRVTPDGRHLLFMTTTDAGFRGRGGFTGYDHADHAELYLYSADSGRLACVSCNPSGRPATADALIDVRENAATSASTSDSAQAISDDGHRAFFNTAEALEPEDTNGRPDAYEYDAMSGSVHLLSSGRSTAPSYFIDATASGDDAFIVTRERLVGWDVDSSYDLYDVRVGGGFPEPAPPPSSCAGEACRGQISPPPSAGAFAQPELRGAGNSAARLRRHRRCGRRAVLRKVRGKRRCVRRRPHRRARRTVVRDGRRGR